MANFMLIIILVSVFITVFQTNECHGKKIKRSPLPPEQDHISGVIVQVHSDQHDIRHNGNGTDADQNLSKNSVFLDGDELDEWEAPYEFRKTYQYYHAGFDDDNRPLWIAEVGKWNFRLVTDGGLERQKTFDKYVAQIAHRLIKSMGERSTPEDPVDSGIIILDMEGFDIVKMSHVPTVSMLLRLLVKFRHILDFYMHAALVVNTSAAAQGLFSLARPILGPIFQRAEIFGTNRANWVPQLLKHVPKKALPEWYGGTSDFKPVKIFG